ncbi:MAG: cytochrome b N-terminal domain-containing protein [Sulfobacillus sp.]
MKPANWVIDRMGIRSFLNLQLYHRVPRRVSPLDFLGLGTLFMFINQVITGIILATWYNASVTGAYQSVQRIMHTVPLGWLIRDLHYWGANFMVVLVFLHMLRGYYIGAYRKPRELVWLTGVGLLLITILFSFTGYLLPWDQQSYWATMVGTWMPFYMPVIGYYIVLLMRGGPYITGVTLTRFYAIHVLVLPALFLMVFGLHFYMVLTKQLTMVEEAEQLPRDKQKGLVTFFPTTVFQMTMFLVILATALAYFSINFHAPLLAIADPLNKAHYVPIPLWFFFSIYQLLKYIPPALDAFGIIGLPTIGILLLVLLPFIDKIPHRKPSERKGYVFSGGVVVAAIAVLTYLGAVNQGVAAPVQAASTYLVSNAATKTATLTLLGGYGTNNGGFNFNGAASGAMVVTIPQGWTLDVAFTNDGSLNHSAAITASPTSSSPLSAADQTPNPVLGVSPGGKASFTFKATTAGNFVIACLVPGHIQLGMWDKLVVAPSGTPSIKL